MATQSESDGLRPLIRSFDIVYYGTQGQLEYDFVVRPGSSPATIDLRFEGADRVELGDHGDLLVHTAGGLVRNGKPVVYQVIDGRRRPVAGAYMLRGASRVGFDVGRYDANVPLVIDPTLVYSTYLGGAQGADIVSGIVVDALGKVYLTGSTSSTDFPATSGAFDTSYNGGPTPQLEGRDVFIAKLNAAGSALEYATYFGGSGLDLGTGIAVDARGRAYVVGYGNSTNVPTTRGAYAEIPFDSWNSFLARLSPDGSALDYATYVGGYTLLGRPNVAVDHTFSAYVAGEISSSRFSATPGAFDATHNGQSDVFVAKLNSSGSGVVYWTYVGGTLIDYPTGVAVDAAGNVYVTGQTQSSNFPTTAGAFDTTLDGGYDGFVLKLNAAGSALEYSTYLGGGEVDVVNGVALDASGHVYVTGQTQSTNFPVSSNAFDPTHNGGPFNGYDAFVAKLNPRGSALDYSTFLGGNGWDYGRAIAVDVLGNAYVTGETSSTDFPPVRAVQSSYGGGISDVFVTKLNGNGSALIYSTYLGGTDNQESAACVAVDHTFNAYVGGHTLALDFPTTPGALAPGKPRTPEGFTAQDGFVAKIADPPGGS
jgi:hypothetical protein